MESLPAKACTKCGEVKLFTEYHKTAAAPDGHSYFCKTCKRTVDAKYCEENRKARRVADRKYYADNREREILRNKKYNAEHREVVATYQREYRKKNIEAISAKQREHREKNKEAISVYHREYSKKNRHRYNEHKRRRRARILGNGVEVYTELQVLETYGTDCHICNGPVDMSAPRGIGRGAGWENGLHIDHVIPISKGGPDTLSNVRPSHSSCNLSKGGRVG